MNYSKDHWNVCSTHLWVKKLGSHHDKVNFMAMDAKINPSTNRGKDWKDLLNTISE